MKVPTLPLATLTAIIIAAMLLLSVGLAYLGVTSYAAYLEEGVVRSLPTNAAQAYRDMNSGIVPEPAAIKELFDHLDNLPIRSIFNSIFPYSFADWFPRSFAASSGYTWRGGSHDLWSS